MDFNQVLLIGRLGKNPVLNQNQTAGSFTLATNHRKADGTDETSWHRVVCFHKTAVHAWQNLGKGSKVQVQGQLRYREYEGKEYAEVVANHILYLDPKNGMDT